MDDSEGDFDSIANPMALAWLEPVGDSACGEDIEYDNEFLELVQAAAGKPGDQFKPEGEPPDWRATHSLAGSLLGRTRDLRVAIYWARAMLHLEGAATLPDSLRLVRGLLARFWDELHPLPDPDDGDAYARINALADMSSQEGLAGDLRQSLIIADRSVGELRGRDVEIALGSLEPREGEYAMTASQIQQMITAACEADPGFAAMPAAVVSELEKLTELMRERVGYDRAPDFSALSAVFEGLVGWVPADGAGDDTEFDLDALSDDGEADPGAARGGRTRGGGLGTRTDSRADALRAIEMVCDYLERAEPTSPAQLLLRRASKLVDKNFLELVREFAPEAFGEVAKVMGVSADESSSY